MTTRIALIIHLKLQTGDVASNANEPAPRRYKSMPADARLSSMSPANAPAVAVGGLVSPSPAVLASRTESDDASSGITSVCRFCGDLTHSSCCRE